jgi:pyruvate dehydrogenase E2 component (dihydrolipoamide acetyltransferase)
MPRLTDQMQEGLIVSWLVEDGQRIAVGDDIVEIETDKATMAVPAEVEGFISIVVPVGTAAPVGAVIARIGAETGGAPVSELVTIGASTVEPDRTEVGGSAPDNGGPMRATPLALRAAALHEVTLEGITGTGPRGRVTKEDVLQAAGIAVTPPEPLAPAQPLAPTQPTLDAHLTDGARHSDTVRELTRLQQVVARRMAEAKATIPHFQVQTDVGVDATIALREELKRVCGDDPCPSLNDFIIKAAALALRAHPLANASYKNEAYALHEQINVGLAIAGDDGLVVATVRAADMRSVGEIARETRRLVSRVRDRTITPPELAGATFTVSNLGMFGMTAIMPVINPPQAAILGVGAARPTLARGDDGEIVEEHRVSLTLSCDHRILNGADAARFLMDIKRGLETPLRLAI